MQLYVDVSSGSPHIVPCMSLVILYDSAICHTDSTDSIATQCRARERYFVGYFVKQENRERYFGELYL